MAFSSSINVNKHLGPGNLQLIEGTWDADSVTKGEIDLSDYLDTIYMAGVSTLTGTGVTLWGWNVEDDMSTSTDGKLSIGACTANDTGQFWAIGPLA